MYMAKERKGFSPSISSADTNKLEQLQKQLNTEESEEEGTVRITIDIPKQFHRDLKKHTKNMGQSLKGYFLWLARQDLQRSKQQ